MKIYISAMCCAVVMAGAASADVLFSEDFEDPVVTGDSAISVTGWVNDLDATDTRLFTDTVNQGVYSWGGSVYTEAFYTTVGMGAGLSAIDLSVDPELRLSLDNRSGWQPEMTSGHFALQMNSTDWYVSVAAVPTATGTWTNHELIFDATATAWNTLTVSGTGSVGAGGATIGAVAGSDLSGSITGVGVVVDRTGSGTMDFDNVVVESIPEPATLGLFGLASGALLFFRRRFTT